MKSVTDGSMFRYSSWLVGSGGYRHFPTCECQMIIIKLPQAFYLRTHWVTLHDAATPPRAGQNHTSSVPMTRECISMAARSPSRMTRLCGGKGLFRGSRARKKPSPLRPVAAFLSSRRGQATDSERHHVIAPVDDRFQCYKANPRW